MTSNAVMVRTPKIMTEVKTVTNLRRNRRFAGSGVSGVSSNVLTLTLAENPPSRLDKAIAAAVPEAASLSRSRLARLIEAGQVRVNGAVEVSQKARVVEGDVVEITVPEAAPTHVEAEDIPLAVVYEDAELIVVDKPVGMVVHPAPGTPAGTLVNALLAHCGETLSGVGGVARPGIVHRIDKDTSGLLVVAKTDAAHHGLAAQFANHSVERSYRAVCYGVPDVADPRIAGLRGVNFETGGTIKVTTGLERHRTDRQKQAVVFGRGRHAVTRARALGASDQAALLECRLETGRTHQIRVHMAYLGHGLIGDPVYGSGRRLRGPEADVAKAFPRQALHAATLGFVHPGTGDTMTFESPLPEDMVGLLRELAVK